MKRQISLLVGLWVVALVSLWLFYVANREKDYVSVKDVVPMKIGDWQAEDLSLKEYVFKLLGTKNVLSRVYRKDGNEVFLSIVMSDTDRRAIHPPEVCLKGGGNKVMWEKVSKRCGIKVNELMLNNAIGQQRVWYWYAVGNNFYTSYYVYQIQFLLNRLLGKNRKGYLIRIVFMDGKQNEICDFVTKFVKEIRQKL